MNKLFFPVEALRRTARPSTSSQQSSPASTPRGARLTAAVSSPPPLSPSSLTPTNQGILGAKEGQQQDALSQLAHQHPHTIHRKCSEPLPGHNPMVLKVLSRAELELLLVPVDREAAAGSRNNTTEGAKVAGGDYGNITGGIEGLKVTTDRGKAEPSSRAVLETLRVLVQGVRDPLRTLEASRASVIMAVPLPWVFEGFRSLLGLRRTDANVRSALYRAMRYLIAERATADAFHRLKLYVFLMRSLERDIGSDGNGSSVSNNSSGGAGGGAVVWERLEALKLYRRLLLEVKGFHPPVSLAMCLVALCGHKEQQDATSGGATTAFRRLCVETLREMAVVNPAMVARCNGFKTLVDAIMDPTLQELTEAITLTLLHVMNDPATRGYIRPVLDIQVLLSPFTNLDLTDVTERGSRLEASRRALTIMMKSWAGLIVLASDERKGLCAVLTLLSDESVGDVVRSALLGVLEDVLHPLVSASLRQFTRVLAEYGAASTSPDNEGSGEAAQVLGTSQLDGFLAFLLCVLLRCRLLECLTSFALSEQPDICARATSLLTDVSRVMPRLLPAAQCVAVLSMPAVVSMCDSAQGYSNQTGFPTSMNSTATQHPHTAAVGAANTGMGNARRRLSARVLALRASDLITRLGDGGAADEELVHQGEGYRDADGDIMACTGEGGELTLGGTVAILRDIHRICHPTSAEGCFASQTGMSEHLLNDFRPYLDSVNDKAVAEAKIARTKVLLGKDPTKWDWDLVLSTIEDTLSNSTRLSDVLKNRVTFLRRLCDQLRLAYPDRGFVADLPWEPGHLRYVLVACNLLHTLLQHPDGVVLLMAEPRARLVHELSSCLSVTIGEAPFASSPGVMDAKALNGTLVREYLPLLLGLFSGCASGMEVLKSASLLPQLLVLSSRAELDYLSRAVLVSLDYSGPFSFPRELLQMWMTSAASVPLRVFAINVLKTLLYCKVPELDVWGMDVLVTQLHFDDDLHEGRVVHSAMAVLQEAAHDPVYLRSIIAKRPELLRRGALARTLLLLSLSVEEGLEYLEQIGWLKTMAADWGFPPVDDADDTQGGMAEPGAATGRSPGPSESEGQRTSKGVSPASGLELREYVVKTEQRLARSLHAVTGGAGGLTDTPAPEPVEYGAPQQQQQQQHQGQQASATRRRQCPVVVRCSGGSEGMPARDVRTLLALPWNIQVQVLSDSNGYAGGVSNSGLVDVPCAELTLDACADVTSFRPVQRYAEDTDEVYGAYVVRVRGVVLDPQTGKPLPYPVLADQSLRACLRVGNCFLDRHGSLQPDHKAHSTSGRNERTRAPSEPLPHGGRASTSFGDLGALACTNEDLMHDFGEPLTPMTPHTGTDMWEDSQVDWSLCRARVRAEAEEAASAGLHPSPADVGYLTHAASSPSPYTSSPSSVSPSPSPQPGPLEKMVAEVAASKDRTRSGSPAHFLHAALGTGGGGSSRGSPVTVPTATGTPSSAQPQGRAYGSARALSYTVVSEEETAKWTFQRTLKRPVSRPPQQVAGLRDVNALCSVEFVVVFDYQDRYTAPLPIHAYGELVKTPRGCRFLQQSGMLDGLLARCQPRQKGDGVPGGHGAGGGVMSSIERRAVLWALGHACSTDLGLHMVLERAPGALSMVAHLAESHDNLSLRAACFQTLQLVARCPAGRAILAKKAGWDVSGNGVDRMDVLSPVALPQDMAQMMRLPEGVAPPSLIAYMHEDVGEPTDLLYEPSTSFDMCMDPSPHPNTAAPGVNMTMEEEVFGLITRLSNYVTRKEAQVQLSKLRRKSRYRRKFQSLRFYLRVLDLLSRYSFKLPARRFVSELFGDVDVSPEAWYDLSLRQCSTVTDAAPSNAEEDDDEEEEDAA